MPTDRRITRRSTGVASPVAAAVVAAALAAAALGPTGLGLPGGGVADDAAAAAVHAVGLDGASALPWVSLETTLFDVCPASGRCAIGPFPASDSVSFGILPLYSGKVTMSVRVGNAEKAVFSCAVPGSCALLGTGAVRSSYRIVGDAAPGSVGEYVVWVSYE